MNKKEKILLKDQLFNQSKVKIISERIKKVYQDFKDEEFNQEVTSRFKELELKERISWISRCLEKYLPKNYRSAVKILIKSLPKENNPELSDGDFGDFIYAPYSDYIAKYGCKKEELEFSLNSLYEITKRFSAEDAIRYFINSFREETFPYLLKWSKDPNYHVRRLSSEGTRPKLPWSQKITLSIDSTIPILDNLFYDDKRFVTRSVANHLNDISKSNPMLVIKTIERWKNSNKQNKKEMDYIVNHSLRSLIKEGNPEAMKLLGVSDKPKIVLDNFNLKEEVKINSDLEFSFELSAKEDSSLILDYIIYFVNKLGKTNSKKVFKLKKLFIKKGEKKKITKFHKFKENMTTRKIYKGTHEIELKINGLSYERKKFEVV